MRSVGALLPFTLPCCTSDSPSAAAGAQPGDINFLNYDVIRANQGQRPCWRGKIQAAAGKTAMASPGATSISVSISRVSTTLSADIAAIQSITYIKQEQEYALAAFLGGEILFTVLPIWIVTLIGWRRLSVKATVGTDLCMKQNGSYVVSRLTAAAVMR